MTAALRAGIALGSNMGDRMAHLEAAVAWLKEVSETPVRCSRVYETSAVECPEGASAFLNAVCEIATRLAPLDLLRKMRHFERVEGREASYFRNAPRPLDMDLLYCGDLRMQTDELTLPHPRMLQRRFVLQPLCDIRPDLALPGCAGTVKVTLDSLEDSEKVIPISHALS